jgi:hypothetical protein
MVCGTFTIRKVPEDKVAETESLFKANEPPPTSVTSKEEDDGTFTVTAVFPKCPEDTSHSAHGH